MDENKNNQNQNTEEPKGLGSLLKQNEIAEAKEKALVKEVPIEERIKERAPQRTSSIVRNLRTLKGDLEEGVTSGKTTLVSMSSSEAGSSKKVVIFSKENKEKTKRVVLIMLILALVGAGSFGVYYAYGVYKQSQEVSVIRETTIISVEKTEGIDLTNKTGKEVRGILVSKRETSDDTLGNMIGLILTKKVEVENENVERRLETDEFFEVIESKAPSRLVRSLSEEFLYGVHIFDGNQPFIVFSVASYETAFAGMLEWEKDMENDIGPLLRKESDFRNTSTTTPTESRVFEDIIFKNTDTRTLRNDKGVPLITYSFPSRETLLITTNKETLGEIVNRLGGRRVIR